MPMTNLVQLLLVCALTRTQTTNVGGTIAILRPIVETSQSAGTDLKRTNPLESADRVLTRFGQEAKGWKNWKGLSFIDYEAITKAQDEVFGAEAPESPIILLRKLQRIADSLTVRYVVTFKVNELSAYHAFSFTGSRQGGRANLSVTVYDAQLHKYVWQETKTETSIHSQLIGGQGSAHYLDQALLNCLKTSLTPFVEGQTKNVETKSTKLVAKVTGLISGGKSVLIDLGQTSGLSIGDTLTSFDGTVKVKITEVFSNGSTAEVTSGTPEKDLVLRSDA